jgi:thiol-disulfide isomerase/thioredoxin
MWFRSIALLVCSLVAFAPLEGRPATQPEHGKLAWFEGGYEAALAKAKAENKLIFIDFWTTWCAWCKRMDRDTYSNELVVKAMGDVICLSIDAESKAGAPIAKQFPIAGYPAMFVVNPDGTLRERISGYLRPGAFLSEMKRVRADQGTLSGLKQAFEADNANLEKRFEYAEKLRQMGATAEADAHVAEIKRLDPERKSMPGRLLRVEEAVSGQIEQLWRENRGAESPLVLEELLRNEEHPRVIYKGRYTLGYIYNGLADLAQVQKQVEAARDYHARSRAAHREAWHACRASERFVFTRELLGTLWWPRRDELGPEDKALALEMIKFLAPTDASEADELELAARAAFLAGEVEQARRFANRCIELEPRSKEFQDLFKDVGGVEEPAVR